MRALATPSAPLNGSDRLAPTTSHAAPPQAVSRSAKPTATPIATMQAAMMSTSDNAVSNLASSVSGFWIKPS